MREFRRRILNVLVLNVIMGHYGILALLCYYASIFYSINTKVCPLITFDGSGFGEAMTATLEHHGLRGSRCENDRS